jgi:hypothetical protein
MLVCERIIRDTRSGRVSLIELLDEIRTADFLLVVHAVAIYARLTDAVGFYAVALDVVRRGDLLEVASIPIGDFEATDPLEDGEILVHHVGLRLPSAGSYDVRLWANGRFVHSVSLLVTPTCGTPLNPSEIATAVHPPEQRSRARRSTWPSWPHAPTGACPAPRRRRGGEEGQGGQGRARAHRTGSQPVARRQRRPRAPDVLLGFLRASHRGVAM